MVLILAPSPNFSNHIDQIEAKFVDKSQFAQQLQTIYTIKSK